MASGNVYGVLGMPAGDLASKQAIKNAGCTHTVVQAQWSALQTGGAGAALDAGALATLQADFDQAASVGLKVFLEIAVHYAPSWVTSAVEGFKDQKGNVWSDTIGSGRGVANWQWTSLGRQYVTDFVTKIAAGLGAARVAQVDAIKTAGGYYGELHYPPASGSGNSWWGFGASMQNGTGLAADQVVCPLPGYIPFGGSDDLVKDATWLNWYLNGLTTWAAAFIGIQRAAGFGCDYHLCLPGFGVRSNQAISTAGYQAAASVGEDPVRGISALMHDSRVWPYSTWLNTVDGFQGGTADSDKAAWKKIAEEAQIRNKHFRMWGENTGGENTAGLQQIFANGQYGSALQGAAYPGAPATPPRFNGLFWLSYSSLTSGSGGASLSDLAAAITAAG